MYKGKAFLWYAWEKSVAGYAIYSAIRYTFSL